MEIAVKLPAACIVMILLGGPAVAVADTLDDTYQSLQNAVAKKDAVQVKKLVAEMTPLINSSLATAAPVSDEERAGWAGRQEYVKSIQTYVEYALYATAVQCPVATMVDLISTLEQQNPKSKYLENAYGAYFVGLTQTGGQARIPAIAERAVENFPSNVDLLAIVADSALAKNQNERAVVFATREIAAFGRPKPEGVPDADWNRKRSIALGRAYWIVGYVAATKNDYETANKNLRAALPMIQGNTAEMAPALFYLGIANYQLGKLYLSKGQVLDAARFSDQCAAIPGPYADQARHNAYIARTDAQKMR